MKKLINRTIIVLIMANLITAGFTLAQDIIEEDSQEALETQTQEADVAQREAEIAEKKAERQAKVAEAQAMIAQQQMKAVEKQQKDIEKKVKALMSDIRIPNVTLPHLQHLQHGGIGGGVLVIPSAEMEVENLAAITEDMSVMSGIFDKQLNQSKETNVKRRVYGDFNPFLGYGNPTTEAIYLEGYGALFLMKINILLSAPPESPQKEKSDEDTDPVWSQMRREMYEPEGVQKRRENDLPEQKYDAEKVETLKTNLIKTLKHATNIQALEPEQLVILTVIGDRHGSAVTVTQSNAYGRSTGKSRVVQIAPAGETNSLLPTVLTISAKKSDIDAFAKGEIDYDQFRQRTGIFKSFAKTGQQDSLSVYEHQVANKEHQVAREEHTAF